MGKTILALLLFLTLSLSGVALATDNGKITICHNTGSESNPTVTITISESAWDAHKEHGDTKGACPDQTASASPTATPTQKSTATPTATATAIGPIPPTRPPFTLAPSAAPTAKATAAPTAPATVTNPPKPPVKQLPSTSTETSNVPYDPGFGE